MWKPIYNCDEIGEEVFDGTIAYQPGNYFDEIIEVEDEQAAIRLCKHLNERDEALKQVTLALNDATIEHSGYGWKTQHERVKMLADRERGVRQRIKDKIAKNNALSEETLNHYMREAAKTAVYPDAGECTNQSLSYLILALCGEAGELANMYKKVLRGDKQLTDAKVIHQLVGELGGVLWYVSQIANELPGWTLKHVAKKNLETLSTRQQRGVIQGDER